MTSTTGRAAAFDCSEGLRDAAGLRDAWAVEPWGGEYTSTPPHRVQRIDAVFAAEGVEVLGCGVPPGCRGHRGRPGRATDHLPVLAALRVPGE